MTEASKGSNLVRYGSYAEEAAKAEQEEVDRGGSDFMKLSPGKNVVRFLPPPVGRNSPFVIVHQHYIKLPGMDSPASFCCPKQMLRKPCPACAEVERLRGTGNPVDYDNAGDLLPKLRVFAKVIDRQKPEMGPRTLAFGKQIHKALTALREEGDFTHPQDGFDVVITRTGTGKNDTEYSVRASRENSPLAESVEQMNDWIEAQGDMGMVSRVHTAEEIARILNITPSDERSGSRGGGTRSAGRRPARSAADDIDTEGEEADDA